MYRQFLTLESRHVRLEPLTFHHAEALVEAGTELGLTISYVNAGIGALLRKSYEGRSIPFATVDKASRKVAGGTAFLEIDPQQRRLEIGSTWLGLPWRRTAINTEAKLLMLTHAFDVMGCVRVEFMVHPENEVSHKALQRIGARKERMLEDYVLDLDGRTGQVVVYRILSSEWTAVKVRIEVLLER